MVARPQRPPQCQGKDKSCKGKSLYANILLQVKVAAVFRGHNMLTPSY